MALHQGPLHSGVVGVKRPRHRLFGAALVDAKTAALAAPPNSVVATKAGALQLQGLGLVKELRRMSTPGGGGGSGADCPELWLVNNEWGREGSLGGGAGSGGAVTASGLQQAQAEIAARLAAAMGAAGALAVGGQVPLAQLKSEILAMKQQVAQLRAAKRSSSAGGFGSSSGGGLPAPAQAQVPTAPQRVGEDAPAGVGGSGRGGGGGGTGASEGLPPPAPGGGGVRRRSGKQAPE